MNPDRKEFVPEEEKQKLSPELEEKKQNIIKAIDLTVSGIDDQAEGNEADFKKKLQEALDILESGKK